MSVTVYRDVRGPVADKAIESGRIAFGDHVSVVAQDYAFLAGWRGRRAAAQYIGHAVNANYQPVVPIGPALVHQLQWVTSPDAEFVIWAIDYYTNYDGATGEPSLAIKLINRATGANVDAGYTITGRRGGLHSGFAGVPKPDEVMQGYLSVRSTFGPLDAAVPVNAYRPLVPTANLDTCFQVTCTNVMPVQLFVWELYQEEIG